MNTILLNDSSCTAKQDSRDNNCKKIVSVWYFKLFDSVSLFEF